MTRKNSTNHLGTNYLSINFNLTNVIFNLFSGLTFSLLFNQISTSATQKQIPFIQNGKLNCQVPELYSTSFFSEKVIPCDGVQNCIDGSDELCDLSVANTICSDDLYNYSEESLVSQYGITKCNAIQDCENLWDEELCFMWLPWEDWETVDLRGVVDGGVSESESNCYVMRERFCKNVDSFRLEEEFDNWKCFRFAKDVDSDASVGYSPYRDKQVLSCVDFGKWEKGEIIVDNSVLEDVYDASFGVSESSSTTESQVNEKQEITEKYRVVRLKFQIQGSKIRYEWGR